MIDTEKNRTVDDVVRINLNEIADDEIGIGLCGIVWDGRRKLHLEGAPLIEFVRRVIVGLARGGATPEDDSFVGPDNRAGLAHFGSDTPEEIADGVVAAWVAAGMPDPEWDEWRFNTAENRATLDELSGRDFYGSPTK